MGMLIEKIFPAVVAEKSTLLKCLFAEGAKRGLSSEDTKAIISIVPTHLIEAGAFLDKMTGLWRYEFGVPYDIAENLVCHFSPAFPHLVFTTIPSGTAL